MRFSKLICLTLLVSEACAIQAKPKRLRESLVQTRQWSDTIVDGCLTPFYYTDQFAYTDKSIGSYPSPAECVAAAKEQCPEYDLVNLGITSLEYGGSSSCYCQKSDGSDLAQYHGTSQYYASCQIRMEDTPAADNTTDCNCTQPSNDTVTLNETEQLADGCLTDWVSTNYFSSGEMNIGTQPNVAECTRQVQIQCPNHDLANVPADCLNGGECSSCWCQKSQGETVASHQQETSWMTCRVSSQNDTVPEVTPQPDEPEPVVQNSTGCIGDWIKTNYFWQGEKNIGAVADQVECADKARIECPDHDLANVHTDCLKTKDCNQCWCQKSNGQTVSNHPESSATYYTCRFKW